MSLLPKQSDEPNDVALGRSERLPAGGGSIAFAAPTVFVDGRFFGRQRCLFGPHAVKFPLPQCFSEYWPHSDNRWHSILRE